MQYVVCVIKESTGRVMYAGRKCVSHTDADATRYRTRREAEDRGRTVQLWTGERLEIKPLNLG